MKKPYYITTAITYTSGIPHIGNVYEVILADSIARFKRKEGFDVLFQTGTDEHGQKIQLKAEEQNIKPQKFVDNISSSIKDIFDSVSIKYDKFVRTTDTIHKKTVQDIFKKLYDQGDIYKGHYEGLYCVPCESFFVEKDLVDGKCPDCNREVSLAKEESYFFKLSNYQEKLVKHIKENKDFIQPESRKNEMLNNFLSDELPDLCVSRTSFDWGIPVEFDKGHVTYVWIDALSNYITSLGYNTSNNHGDEFNKYWPADVHLIGKDILRFHTIYWPIMLLALDIELPKQVFGHPWVLLDDGKMSKSKGNVIYIQDLIDLFGVDATRYYMLHETPFAQDGTYSHDIMIERYNSDLVNTIANLVNRTISMVLKYNDGIVEKTSASTEFDVSLIEHFEKALPNMIALMDKLKVADVIEEVLKLARRANKYIDETQPWVLGKDSSQKDLLNNVLYNLIESIRYISTLIEPFTPDLASNINKQIHNNKTSFSSLSEFGQYNSNVKLEKPQHIFSRIDPKEKNKEIEKRNENTMTEVKENYISIDEFFKSEIKVGEIVECEKHPDADKLLVSKVNTGEKVRTIVSGIAKHYKPEELVGKRVQVVANLKPVKLRGVLSEGMILCASDDEGNLEIVETKLKAGSIVK